MITSKLIVSGWSLGWNVEPSLQVSNGIRASNRIRPLTGRGARLLIPLRAAQAPLRFLTLIFFLFILNVIGGTVWAQEAIEPAPETDTDASYRLGPGDNIQVSVHNQDDLSGSYLLDGSGRFSMPLIGTVEANGLTRTDLETLLVSRLKPDYLVNPRVAVVVSDYRPYYIIGEVGRTGAFSFVQGMTYLTAIAIAGGYSYRAKKGVVFVIQGDDPDREEVKLDVDLKVQPGDIIRVAERRF